MPTWWEQRPGLLREELEALEAAGIEFELDEQTKARGVIALTARVPVGHEIVLTRVVYPDLYPYVRFEVFAPELSLPRHQNPFDGNLCLIGRSTGNWDVADSAAQFLTTRLPAVLTAARAAADESSVAEEPQGEPLSDYYPTQPGAAILVDGSWQLPAELSRGTMTLLLPAEPPGFIGNRERGLDAPLVRGALAELRDAAGNVVFRASDNLLRAIRDPVQLQARWLRLDPPPPPGRQPAWPAPISAAVDEAWPGRHRARYASNLHLDIVGITFREELGYGRFGTGWLFLVRAARGRSPQGVSYLAKAHRVGERDVLERIPEVASLRSRTVAIVGAGGLGAPVALELARAGVNELRLLDHDRFDAATLVRWPFGLAFAGEPKVEILRRWITDNVPYTRTEAYVHRLGGVRADGRGASDQEVLQQFLEGADLLIDCTAEIGLHYPLSMAARQRRIPYLEVSTRNGAWGGLVARISGERGAPCWLCYQHHLSDLREAGVAPNSDPSPLVQPTGCADPTFTGTGFDVAYFANAATRLAVQTLITRADTAYPDSGWDFATINLRNSDGSFDHPAWRTFALTQHPRCPEHQS